jgi:adenylate cyclase
MMRYRAAGPVSSGATPVIAPVVDLKCRPSRLRFDRSGVDHYPRRTIPADTRCFSNAAVLFADMVGFTRFSEGKNPARTIDFLRQYYAHIEAAVSKHRGCHMQYVGDGVMAAFGADGSVSTDATNAVRCAFDLLRAIDHWNVRRQVRGRNTVRIGVGVHIGPIAVGEIFVNQRRELAIVGDTVNIASKLETLTRRFSSPLIVSGDVIEAVQREEAQLNLLTRLTKHGRCEIPGRVERVVVWMTPPKPDCSLRSP